MQKQLDDANNKQKILFIPEHNSMEHSEQYATLVQAEWLQPIDSTLCVYDDDDNDTTYTRKMVKKKIKHNQPFAVSFVSKISK